MERNHATVTLCTVSLSSATIAADVGAKYLADGRRVSVVGE